MALLEELVDPVKLIGLENYDPEETLNEETCTSAWYIMEKDNERFQRETRRLLNKLKNSKPNETRALSEDYDILGVGAPMIILPHYQIIK